MLYIRIAMQAEYPILIGIHDLNVILCLGCAKSCFLLKQVLLEGGGFKAVFDAFHVDVLDVALAHIRAAEIQSAKVGNSCS